MHWLFVHAFVRCRAACLAYRGAWPSHLEAPQLQNTCTRLTETPRPTPTTACTAKTPSPYGTLMQRSKVLAWRVMYMPRHGKDQTLRRSAVLSSLPWHRRPPALCSSEAC